MFEEQPSSAISIASGSVSGNDDVQFEGLKDTTESKSFKDTMDNDDDDEQKGQMISSSISSSIPPTIVNHHNSYMEQSIKSQKSYDSDRPLIPPTPTETVHIEELLAAAEQDLNNADYHFGFLLNPVRSFVLKPALQVANAALPPLAKAVPGVDGVSSLALQATINVGRTLYHVAHHDQDSAEYKIHHQIEQDFGYDNNPRLQRLVLQNKASEHATKGFVQSAIVEIASDPVGTSREWTRFTRDLADYLSRGGIDAEVSQPLQSLRFQQGIQILARIQAMQDNVDIRRMETALPPSQVTFDEPIHKVAKLMRYACSAYGRQIMEATDIVAQKNSTPLSETYKSMVGSEALKQQVCDYVRIPTRYISYFCMGHGGSMKLLRHYISIDDDLKAVCLVVRGTYSVSGWHIDFQGQAVPFCHGQAHKGISEMATNLVDHVRDRIVDDLQRNPGYKLIITGQSLGGGVTPLINLLMHCDPVVNQHEIECHAFAGPPVYKANYDEMSSDVRSMIDRAYDNCIHYVNGTDVVPYCSVHTVRRLAAKLTALDRAMKRAKFLDPAMVANGLKPPTAEMVSAYMYGDAHIKPIEDGAPVLETPCRQVVWFSKDPETNVVDYAVCDPAKFIERGFLLSLTGCPDHIPPVYCEVLNYAEDHRGWDKRSNSPSWLKGYYVEDDDMNSTVVITENDSDAVSASFGSDE